MDNDFSRYVRGATGVDVLEWYAVKGGLSAAQGVPTTLRLAH